MQYIYESLWFVLLIAAFKADVDGILHFVLLNMVKLHGFSLNKETKPVQDALKGNFVRHANPAVSVSWPVVDARSPWK